MGREETPPDSIIQEWLATQHLIQKEASDQRDIVQTGQRLLKFMNTINSAGTTSVPFLPCLIFQCQYPNNSSSL